MTELIERVEHHVRVIDGDGDSRFTWNPNVPAEVEEARKHFNELKTTHRYLAYTVNEDGTPGEVMSEFDPNAKAVVMRPQLVGG